MGTIRKPLQSHNSHAKLTPHQSQAICASLYNAVELASLRLRIIDCIPPTRSSRLHELRRRLALTFYFSDLSKSLHPPQTIISIPTLTLRLQEPAFHINRNTDYRELAALILLLDVAIDNGRSDDLDLEDKEVERQFNNDVDDLATKVTSSYINFSGAANLSRVEAKEIMELVGNRIKHTVRSRPKPKHNIYEESMQAFNKREKTLGGMQENMSKYLNKT